jgi:transcriptional regulator with XRE-family HTH domain
MNLRDIGLHVRERREALGLSQHRLARLAGLSRATVNQLENGTLADLGVAKLANLLELLGLQLATSGREATRHGLNMASSTASVSYRDRLRPDQLAQALASGELPPRWLPHVATLIDEAPLPLVVSAVEEAAERSGVPPKRLWQHLTRWAHELRSPRSAWA